MRWPWSSRSRIGKSRRIRSTSSGVGITLTSALRSSITLAIPASVPSLRLGGLLLDPELLADPLVALLLQLLRQLRAARQDDPAVHHHVDPVRRDVVEDPLVVR